MSYSWDQQQQYGWGDQSSFSYDMGSPDFGQEQQFQSFDYSNSGGQGGPPPTSTYNNVGGQQPSFFTPGPSIMTPGPNPEAPVTGDSIDDEPPLLEELGINPESILQKTLTVLNPMRRTNPMILQDTDLAGPLAFCLAFGSFLLLSGKAQFGYIYGIGMLGCVSMYGLLNMMSMSGVNLGVVVSILGYCLLPMVGLAGVNVLISLQGAVGMVLTGAAILWCSVSASKLFVTGLAMDHQQPLVAYPCALLYAVFALITIF
ncbi:protein YIPF5-like [Penaeus japonicus]|uniref:protein YIPF5-like n=1 Tax=Penaeus japonicus TaxID=27405 RepID=UPI001C711FDE|nr:protein YIPF5-like [Penaeus japonicus]